MCSSDLHPDTSLADRLIYSFLLMTIWVTLDSVIDLGNSENVIIYIGRLVVLGAAMIYPGMIYVEIFNYHKYYLEFKPLMLN